MHFRVKALCLMLLAFLLLSQDAVGQKRRRNKYQRQRAKSRKVSKYRGRRVVGGSARFRPYHFVGAGVNALNYFGDLAPVNRATSTDISFTRPGFSLIYGYKFHPAIAARVSITRGLLVGDDFTSDPNDGESAPRYARNLSFRNNITELAIGAEFYILPNYGGPRRRQPFNAYIFAGIAGFHHEPKAQLPDADYQDPLNPEPLPNAGELVKLRPLKTEGVSYSPFQIAIPVAIGGVLSLPNNLSVGLELGVRFLFTDYIDDVSSQFLDLESFGNRTARILSDRSAEPIAVESGDARQFITNSSSADEVRFRDPFSADTFTTQDGQTFNHSGFINSGRDGSQRGNENDNDLYFVTQIRVIYAIPARRRQTAKFR